MKNFQMFINGEWVDAVSGETFDNMNPYDGGIYGTMAKGNEKDARRAVDAAEAAKKEWASTPPGQRAKILYTASRLLASKTEEYAEVLISEGGAMFGKAMYEVSYVVDLIHTAGEDCRRITGETLPSDHNKLSMTVYSPLGIVVAISPWNFPFLLSMNKVAYALAAGNTVVLKPASETPVIGLKIAELFEAAGLPKGVLNVVTGPGSIIGNALITDDRTDLVSFTGETVTGRHIAKAAASAFKRYTLEMGGKDPLIVLGDADIEYAVNAAAFGAFMHQGQICMSVERLIVEASIADEFSEKLVKKAATLKIGDPHDPETVIGPLINDEQINTVHSQVRDAVDRGARLLTGGNYEGRLYQPTILSGVTRDMKIFTDETFGPAAPILAVKDVDEALAVANDSAYGLSSGVITNDLQKALYIAENLESGMVHINDQSVYDEPYCPFGGCKDSGVGREGGRHSMEEMSRMKWMTIQRGKRAFPF